MTMRTWIPVRQWRCFGARVYVHWHVLIAISLLAVISLRHVVIAISAALSYLLILVVHEVGHAAIARRLGYEVLAIRIGVIHGHCEFEHPDSALHACLIAWGGVIAQFLVAAAVFGIAAALPPTMSDYFGVVIVLLGYINLVVALVNLVPASGMDGAVAWKLFPELIRVRRGR
jgi:Zn-dependent protease